MTLALSAVILVAATGLYFAGEVTGLLFLCVASLGWCCYYNWSRSRLPSLYSWFSIAYCSLFLFGPSLTLLLGLAYPADDATFSKYCFLSVAGIHLFTFGYAAAERTSRTPSAQGPPVELDPRRVRQALGIMLAFNVAALAILAYEAGSPLALLTGTRGDTKVYLSANILPSYLFGIGTLFPTLLGIVAQRSRFAVIASLLFLVAFDGLIFVVLRTRTLMVQHMFAFLVGWLFIAPRAGGLSLRRRRRSTLTQKVAIVSIVAMVGIAGVVTRAVRGQMEQASSFDQIDVTVAGALEYDFQGGSINYAPIVCSILEIVPSRHGFLYGQTYYRLLFLPIPRAIWPDKPENEGQVMARWLDPYGPAFLSIPVGVIGDLYVNFGVPGVLGMIVYGFVFGKIDFSKSFAAVLLISASFSSVFHVARGNFTNPVILLILCWIASVGVSRMIVARGRADRELLAASATR